MLNYIKFKIKAVELENKVKTSKIFIYYTNKKIKEIYTNHIPTLNNS